MGVFQPVGAAVGVPFHESVFDQVAPKGRVVCKDRLDERAAIAEAFAPSGCRSAPSGTRSSIVKCV